MRLGLSGPLSHMCSRADEKDFLLLWIGLVDTVNDKARSGVRWRLDEEVKQELPPDNIAVGWVFLQTEILCMRRKSRSLYDHLPCQGPQRFVK